MAQNIESQKEQLVVVVVHLYTRGLKGPLCFTLQLIHSRTLHY
jgi:hypothetical protein